jgi:hypothetical protein
MNERLYEALEVCLNALEAGADLGSVLKRFPDLQDELRPLLEAAQKAKTMAISEVPEKALRGGKMRVLQHVAELREGKRKQRRRWSMFAFPRLATSLAIALIFLLSGTGLVSASSGALPGDSLYPVKRTWEDVRLALVVNPTSREHLEDQYEQERLHEVDELLVEKRPETITFTGMVTDQIGDQWKVSGIAVQITSSSQLPLVPVLVGSSIMVSGRTNAQGFVEAEHITFLKPEIVLPTMVPTKENPKDIENNGNSGTEINDNGFQEEMSGESISNNDNPNDSHNQDEGEKIQNNNNASSGHNESSVGDSGSKHNNDSTESNKGSEDHSNDSTSGGSHNQTDGGGDH